MSTPPEDWDELFLRYLGGEADADLERRVRERLLSDESARVRLVALACQQQALTDVLTEAAGRTPSSRVLLPRPAPPRANAPRLGWMFAAAAAAAAIALFGYLGSRPDPGIPRKGAAVPKPEARSADKARSEEEPKKAVSPEEKPPLPSPPLPQPERKESVEPLPVPKPVEKKPEASETPFPAPKPEAPAKTVTETVVATLERIEGELWILADGRRTKAEAKQAIYSGQGVETAGPAGAGEIAYADGTRLKLGPLTLVRDFLEPKPRAGKRLFLAQGVLTADVRKQPGDQPMLISTPQGEATVVGTRLRLSVDGGEKGSTRLEVEEGKVRLKRLLDGKLVDVASGHFAVAATTASEFKALPSILSGLVGYWRFEEAAGLTATDSSGQGNDGALLGKSRRILGKFGQGLEFDGTTASVQVPHAPSLNPGSSMFSISIWLRNRKQDVWPWNVVFKDNGKFQSYYFLSVGTKPKFEFSTGDAKVSIEAQAGVNDNRWHHLVAVRNGLYSGQFFVDGVLDSSASVAPSQTSTVQTSSPLIIGAGYQTFYAGQVDEVRIYNRALSADEVRQLFSGR